MTVPPWETWHWYLLSYRGHATSFRRLGAINGHHTPRHYPLASSSLQDQPAIMRLGNDTYIKDDEMGGGVQTRREHFTSSF